MSKPTSKKHPRQIEEEENAKKPKIPMKLVVQDVLFMMYHGIGLDNPREFCLCELAKLSNDEKVEFTAHFEVHAAIFRQMLGLLVTVAQQLAEVRELIQVDDELRLEKYRQEHLRFAIELSDLTHKWGDKFDTPIANLVGQFATSAITLARPLQPRTFRKA